MSYFSRFLGTLALGLILLAPGVAAADALPGGLIEVLPASDLVGDGATESTLHLVALDASGKPVEGLKAKTSATAGDTGELTDLGNGLYRFTYVPPAVSVPGTATVTVKGRGADKQPFEVSRTVLVLPASAGSVAITANPASMVLGKDTEATLSFQLPAGVGEISADDLLVRVSSGEVVNLTSMGKGKFIGRYVPAKVNYPHLALVTAADRRDPSRIVGAVAIPLNGKVDYPVQAAPGASVLLEVGGREFGPVVVGSDGKARVPITVPPGASQASLVEVSDSGTARKPLDLKVPETRRIQIFPPPAGVPADSQVSVPVRLAVVTSSGQPDVSARPDLTVTAGALSEVAHEGNGIYRATFTPPDARVATAATLQATLPGSNVQSDGAEFTLVPALPGKVSVTAEPERLAAQATALKLFVRVEGADGAGLSGRPLRIQTAGARVKGDPTDLKGGDYRVDLSADEGTNVVAQVAAAGMPTANALRNVVLLPASSVLPTGSGQSTSVLVITTDAFGYPIANVSVELSVLSGGGSLPTKVTTDRYGIGEVVYVAGDAPGLATLQARAGGFSNQVGIVQGLPSGPLLPVGGTTADVAMHAAWRASVARLTVSRDGAADAIATARSEAPAGSVARLAVTVEPAKIAPGGKASVRVRATNKDGMGVSGLALDMLATGGGRFGTLRSSGDGVYEAELRVPNDASGTIKVSALADGGALIGVAEVQVTAEDEVSPWSEGDAWSSDAAGPAATPVQAPDGEPVASTPAEPAPIAPGKEKKARSGKGIATQDPERPWFRARGSAVFSSYNYRQTPGEVPGDLLDTELAWGAGRGSPAAPIGGEAQVRLFLPMFSYIGVHADFRGTRYAVGSSTFSERAQDSLLAVRLDAVARVPITVGSDMVHIGARLGFRWDDFISFRGCSDAGCLVEYGPVGVAGLDTGIEFGAEFWKMYTVIAASGGFAYGSVPYAITAEANLGWNITKNVFIDAGFTYIGRRAELRGADSGLIRGEIADRQLMGTVGAGFSF